MDSRDSSRSAFADRAALETDHVDLRRVVFVRGENAVASFVGERGDLGRFLANEPEQRVHRVTAGRKQGTAAGFLRDVPSVLFVPRANAVEVIYLGIENPANCVVVEQRTDRLEKRIPAQHETRDGFYARLFHGGTDGFEFGQIHRDGFFHDDVFTRARSINSGYPCLAFAITRPP